MGREPKWGRAGRAEQKHSLGGGVGVGVRGICCILATTSEMLQLLVFREFISPENKSTLVKGNFPPSPQNDALQCNNNCKNRASRLLVRIPDIDPTTWPLRGIHWHVNCTGNFET